MRNSYTYEEKINFKFEFKILLNLLL